MSDSHPKVVKLSTSLADVPGSLRSLAPSIEEGKFGDAHGNEVISVGFIGSVPKPGVEAYYMLGLGMRHLEQS